MMWKAILLLAAVSGAAAKAQAPAAVKTQWAACFMEASGGVGTSIAHITFEPFQVRNSSGTVSAYDLARQFHNTVGVGSLIGGYQPITGSYTNGCEYYATRAEAAAEVGRLQNKPGYSIMKTVAWTPPESMTGLGGSGASANVTASSGSKGAYEGRADVEAATPPVEPGWDAKLREQQRKDAVDRMRAAAGTERMRAESRAAFTKLLAELRKRGSAQ